MSLAYRRDIDGLRAIAILSVLLYHAGIPFFTGGFVGVDIFFVISGFLITGILIKSINDNTYSLLTFYERRIRRIFPALFGVLLVTTIAAVVLLLPQDLANYGKSLAAAALSVSNINFWMEGGYFDTVAITKPLLHTWSLAVEEQFYLFFPPCLVIIYRYFRFPLFWIWLAFIGSLALSMYGVRHSGQATFYLLPTRAWELLIGSLIALNAFPKLKSNLANNSLGLAGLAMTILPIFIFTEATRFPGENAILPCLGAALIIFSGSAKSFVSRMLGLGPFVFIGLISYSLYLWHWPLLAFLNYQYQQPLPISVSIAAVAASFALAYLSWLWLETPFRKGSNTIFTTTRKRILISGVVLMAIAVGVGGFLKVANGLPSRINPAVLQSMKEAEASLETIKPCLNAGEKSNFKTPTEACTFPNAQDQTGVVVWGDSHATALIPALLPLAQIKEQGMRVLAMSGCYPLPNTSLAYNQHDYCRSFNAANLEYLLTGPEKTIIWTARWTNSVYAVHPGLTTQSNLQLTLPESEALFERSFTETLNKLLATGKKIIVTDPVPEAPYDVPRYTAIHYPAAPEATVRIPAAVNDSRMDQLIAKLISGTSVVHVQPKDRLCNTEGCIIFGEGKMYYSDSNHLSKAGAELISELFVPALATSK